MKILFSILLALVFITNINAQTFNIAELETKLNLEKVEYKYDKFQDQTQLNIKSRLSKKTDSNLMLLNIFTSFSGKTPPSDVKIFFGFISFDKTKQYDKNRSLIILADNERIKPVEFAYEYEPARSNLISEVVSYELSRDDLQKIAESKSVEMQLRTTEFAFNAKQLLLIRDFYKKLVP